MALLRSLGSKVSTHAPLRQRGERVLVSLTDMTPIVSTHAPLRQRGEHDTSKILAKEWMFQPTPRFVSEANGPASR